MKIARTIVGVLAAGTLAAVGYSLPVPDPVTPQPDSGVIRAMPCATEDGGGSLPCYWDARVQGNGEGESYILWPDPNGGDPWAEYVDPETALPQPGER